MRTRITRRGFTIAMAATVAASAAAALALTPMAPVYANAPAPPATSAAANANPIIVTDTAGMYDVMNGQMPKMAKKTSAGAT